MLVTCAVMLKEDAEEARGLREDAELRAPFLAHRRRGADRAAVLAPPRATRL